MVVVGSCRPRAGTICLAVKWKPSDLVTIAGMLPVVSKYSVLGQVWLDFRFRRARQCSLRWSQLITSSRLRRLSFFDLHSDRSEPEHIDGTAPDSRFNSMHLPALIYRVDCDQ